MAKVQTMSDRRGRRHFCDSEKHGPEGPHVVTGVNRRVSGSTQTWEAWYSSEHRRGVLALVTERALASSLARSRRPVYVG